MIIKSIIKCVLVVSWDSKTLIEQQQQQLAESVHLSVLLVISLTTSASYVVTLFTCQIYECAPAAANAVASCDTALMFRRRSRTPHAMTTSAASVANRLSPSQFHCTQAADIASDPITHICLFFYRVTPCKRGICYGNFACQSVIRRLFMTIANHSSISTVVWELNAVFKVVSKRWGSVGDERSRNRRPEATKGMAWDGLFFNFVH